MATGPLQVIIILFSLFALSRLVLRRKDRAIPLGELIFWAVIWLGAITLSIFPNLLSSAADQTGVESTINLIIAIAIIILFYLQFRLYVKVEQQGQDITRLVREISLRGKK
ncbi:MAG: DUF2304 family protein [Candidatus Woesearchaeota archaeon]